MDKIHYKEIEKNINLLDLVNKSYRKYEPTEVYKDDNFYYKLWPSSWFKSNVVKITLENGFYTDSILPVPVTLIHDNIGQRGYVMKKGKVLIHKENYRKWDTFVENTTRKQRKSFILNLLNRSLYIKGTHVDLCPSNLILYNDEISLIDLNSYNTFDFIFRKKPASYEDFRETTKEDLFEYASYNIDLFYRDYLEFCLDIKYDKKIDSEQSLKDIKNLVKKRG